MAAAAFLLVAVFSFTKPHEASPAATAHKISGVYVFTDSDPTGKYETLGTVKVAIARSAQYTDVRDKLIKKAKKEYPDCQGVVLNLRAGKVDEAEAIKFE